MRGENRVDITARNGPLSGARRRGNSQTKRRGDNKRGIKQKRPLASARAGVESFQTATLY
jgi:hypothetical protein